MSEPKTRTVTVEQLWIEYRDSVYPPAKVTLDKLQETETRQAFFAGCAIAVKVLVESAQELTEAEACRNIELFADECQATLKARVYELKSRN